MTTKDTAPIHLSCPQCETEAMLVFVSACTESPEGHVTFLCSRCGEQLATLAITPASLAEVQADLAEDERPRSRRRLN